MVRPYTRRPRSVIAQRYLHRHHDITGVLPYLRPPTLPPHARPRSRRSTAPAMAAALLALLATARVSFFPRTHCTS
jgi:hypothetical protein